MKILLVLAFTASSIIGSAQNFVYTPSQDVGGTIEGRVNEYLIGLRTPTAEEITYKWERVSNTFPADWDYSICDHNHCYIGLPAKGEMNSISLADAEAGTNGYFKVTMLETPTDGKGIITIYVYDSKDKARGDTVTFTVRKGVSGIETTVSADFKVYPNPTASEINVYTAAIANLQIVDLQGKEVMNSDFQTAGLHKINVDNLPNGVYILKLNEQGVIRNSRFIVAH
jgi:hypothetical protein